MNLLHGEIKLNILFIETKYPNIVILIHLI